MMLSYFNENDGMKDYEGLSMVGVEVYLPKSTT
jgi:hypothetical protein